MDLNLEYNNYVHLVEWLALKIYRASTLPNHIKDEFVSEARYSLIITLNNYSTKDITKKKIRQELKNRVAWDAITHINKYWCKIVGCKNIITQKKHNLFHQSLDDIKEYDQDQHGEPINYNYPIEHNTASHIVVENETHSNTKFVLKQLKRKLKLNKKDFNILTMSYGEFKSKFPNINIQDKNYDNHKTKLKRNLALWIKNNPEYIRRYSELLQV